MRKALRDAAVRAGFWTLMVFATAADAQERVFGGSARDWTLSAVLQGDALATADAPAGDEKTTELRRARLAGRFGLASGVRLAVGGEFSRGGRLAELYLDVRRFPVYVLLGRFPEPFGLAAQEGSRSNPMMERPLASAIGPGFGTGLGLSYGGDRWAISGGVFKATGAVSDEDQLRGGRKEDAITLRLTGTPARGLDHLLHVGVAASQRKPRNEFVRFIAIPESVLVRNLQVSSGIVPVEDRYLVAGAELALQAGPVLLQSEYLRASTQLDPQLPTSVYDGGYVEAAWALTGERRPYNGRLGVFGPITPNDRWDEGRRGAWELATRYSRVDFSRNPLAGIEGFENSEDFGGLFTGGRGQVISAGLNWYPTGLMRVSLDGLHVERRREGETRSANLLQLRVFLQFDLRRNDLR